MDLRCTAIGMIQNGEVEVDGTVYKIAPDGLCVGVSEGHAMQLLGGQSWRPVQDISRRVAAKPALKAEPKPEVKGEELPPPPKPSKPTGKTASKAEKE